MNRPKLQAPIVGPCGEHSRIWWIEPAEGSAFAPFCLRCHDAEKFVTLEDEAIESAERRGALRALRGMARLIGVRLIPELKEEVLHRIKVLEQTRAKRARKGERWQD